MLSLDQITDKLIYKKNIFQKWGIFGIKEKHLQADPLQNYEILTKAEKKIGLERNLSAFEKTRAQFFCQEQLYSNLLQKTLTAVFFFFLQPCVLFFIIYRSVNVKIKEKFDVFIFNLGDVQYAAEDFVGQKVVHMSLHDGIGYFFGLKEYQFLLKTTWKNKKIFFYPKLVVNILRWLSRYGWVIKVYQPKTICTFFEGTPSCSLLTEYLNEMGIAHFNYAHGEHFKYDPYSAYAFFNRYTIWGKHFKEIQIEKKCLPEMFSLRAPQKFKDYFYSARLRPHPLRVVTVLIHSGVYKGSSEYQALIELFTLLKNEWSIFLRPHPMDRATWPQVMLDLKYDMLKLGHNDQIKEQMPEDIGMKKAIDASTLFFGSASAALLEALVGGCKIIYLPGRVKNNNIYERHQNSKNVFVYSENLDDNRGLQDFLEQPYVISASEEEKLRYLFEF